jgi:hypothetical protein
LSICVKDLENVDNYWAVLAIGVSERDRCLEVANALLVAKALGKQMHLGFKEKSS